LGNVDRPTRKNRTSAAAKSLIAKGRTEIEKPKNREKEPKPAVEPKERPAVHSNKNNTLAPWWEDILSNRDKTPRFDLERVERGTVGIQQAFSFWKKNAVQPSCSWGRGRSDASVVLVEGYSAPLGGEGLKMLGRMRTNVLGLPKEKLYWIPLSSNCSCGLCNDMALAQLYAIQPKAILVMGDRPLDVLRISNREKALRGEEVPIPVGALSAPAICTFHPMYLIENNKEKKNALRALYAFKRILNRLGIVN